MLCILYVRNEERYGGLWITGQPFSSSPQRVDTPAVRCRKFTGQKAHTEKRFQVLLEHGLNRLLDCVDGAGQFIDRAGTDAEEFDVAHDGPSPSALATLRKRSSANSRLSTISAATSSGGGSRSGSSSA